jgi:hypothetical protein
MDSLDSTEHMKITAFQELQSALRIKRSSRTTAIFGVVTNVDTALL